MCGIFGYIGRKKAAKIVLDGLKKLEYRGYDSAGIVGIHQEKLAYCKIVGKIALLEQEVELKGLHFDLAIGQTRWATHGKVSKINAHPHFDTKETLAIVHNGIIENYEILRNQLKNEGAIFRSETDSEVIAHLVAKYYEGDFLKAVQQAIPLLEGSYATVMIHKDHPDMIIAAAKECPLVIGLGADEAFISSDSLAFAVHTREIVRLSHGEIAVIRTDQIDIFNASQEPVNKKVELLDKDIVEATKGSYEHYTLKEIHEQPQTLKNALLSRFIDEYGTAVFEELTISQNDLLSVDRILILGCGTSLNAAYVSRYLIEEMARIPVEVEISSEFRYKNPIILPNTLVLAISQSGETADTLAAVREVKNRGAPVLAICNVHDSSLTREADSTFFLRSGPEVGVCSTKAFTSQIVVLALFTLMMARMRNLSKSEGQIFLDWLKQIPDQVQSVLNQEQLIQLIAEKYAHYENFFFLGRHYLYPTSLEGALKLKEISYINANGYPAGEMKHGPIALINENCPTVALCANRHTYTKLLSNLMEIKARHGKIIAIAEEGQPELQEIADDIILIPSTIDSLAVVPSAVATQLLAYWIARKRGAEIDQPRNLAKSVTVE